MHTPRFVAHTSWGIRVFPSAVFRMMASKVSRIVSICAAATYWNSLGWSMLNIIFAAWLMIEIIRLSIFSNGIRGGEARSVVSIDPAFKPVTEGEDAADKTVVETVVGFVLLAANAVFHDDEGTSAESVVVWEYSA